MFPVMQSAHRLNGALFILMISAMLIYSLPAVYQFSRSQTNATELFLDGKLLRTFERRYDRNFFLREPSEKAWATLQYAIFGEGLSGVVLGKDGWLFTNQEYVVPSDLGHNLDHQVSEILRMQALLKENGKELIVLPVPMKVDIYQQHARYAPSHKVTQLYERFVAALHAVDIDVVPIRDGFIAKAQQLPLFLRQDTHWSPYGSQLAAQLLAKARPELKGTDSFYSVQVGKKTRDADLLNYLRFSHELAPWLEPKDEIALYETLKTDSAVLDDSTLFGNDDQLIALVGSSYSSIDDWNFSGFLKENLHRDIVTMAVEAKGPLQAMEAFLNSPQLADPDIQLVIWEYPVRTVLAQRSPSKAWQNRPGH